jgi:hypothetical protein
LEGCYEGGQGSQRAVAPDKKKKNVYHQQIIHQKQKHKLPTNNSQGTQKSKWVTFPYYGPDTRKITKLFKNTNLRIAFKATNTKPPKTKRGNKGHT